MSTSSVLAELRRKKRCLERAIRAMEQLQRLEQAGEAGEKAGARRRTGTSKVVEIPRRHREV